MAGRWKSAQRRKRWTDHAVLLPEGTLGSLEPWPALQPFASQLATFGHQPSIHAQLSLVKKLGNNLLAALQLSPEEVRIALLVYVELLFVEHSRLLHRGLLSTLSHVSAHEIEPLRDAFMACCQEYGSRGAKRRRFAVVAVSASLASLPQPGVMKEVVRSCASSLSGSLCLDVRSVLQHALDGGRPTPTDMEECQDALSSIYYLLQQFPDEFHDSGFLESTSREEEGPDCHSGGESKATVKVQEQQLENYANARNLEHFEFSDGARNGELSASANFLPPGSEERRSRDGGDLYGAIVCALLDVLQTAVLSRDCLVAAGVGLAAAAQLSSSQEGLALVLASATFPSAHYSFAVLSPDEGLTDATGGRGILESAIRVIRKSSLRAEVEKLSDFGKLCFFRGLLTSIPRGVQNVHLLRSGTEFKNGCESEAAALKQLGNTRQMKEPERQIWTLLYDGILPALCRFCQSSVDSHFKFHAFTAMQICLQQIKTSICGHLTHSAFECFELSLIRRNMPVLPYDPLPAARLSQVLQLIWNNWEDPLTQTVKQVQVVFDLLVDVQLVHKRDMYGNQSVEKDIVASGADEEKTQVFLQQIASDLLGAGRYRKGKYVPLSSLVLRIGARNMLQMSPELLFQTIDAFSDDDVCSSASTFLKTFLERLKEDFWSAEGVNEGTTVARRFWIPPLLSGLLTGDARLRNNLTTYALPVAMYIDSDSLPLLLAYILDGYGKAGFTAGEGSSLSWEELRGAHGLPGLLAVEQQVILLISVLKVARSLALVEGSIEQKLTALAAPEVELKQLEDNPNFTGCSLVVQIKDQPVEFPVSLLLLALTHKEDGLRVDAAELVCLNPKTASMPSPIELRLLRIALPLNMRCSSTAFRMRWTSFLKKFFLRVRTAVEKQQKAENLTRTAVEKQQKAENRKLSRKEQIEAAQSRGSGGGSDQEDGVIMSVVTVEQMQEFMQWLSQMLVSSLYPAAPYERKTMAMEIFNALLEVWSLKQSWEKRSGRFTSSPYLDTVEFSPYHTVLFSVDFTLVVVGALVDSWDRLREGAYRILMRFPTPLPGLDVERSVEELLTWAKGMVNSPRVRESDAGALALRFIFRKYVIDLGWSVKVHLDPKVVIKPPSAEADSGFEQGRGEATVQYLESLNDWLQWGIEEGEKDLLKACTHSFVHGVLLVLRYTVEEIDWTSSGVQCCSDALRAVLARLLALLLRVTSLALWVVSSDALNLQEQQGDSVEFDFVAAATSVGAVNDGDGSFLEECLAPPEQMVMVGCWLSVKEVSLLLGTIARVVPLPGSPSTPKADQREKEPTPGHPSSPESFQSSPMLDGKQLEAIGSHFVQVLLSMKHNGAIDKTRTGFTALSDRLLRSSDPRLNKLPEIWLQQLTDHTGARGQVVDDLLRRSAGIPPAFLALFLAEPEGSPKKLLPMGMRWLLDTCKDFLLKSRCQSVEAMSESKLSQQSEQDLLQEKEPVLPVDGVSGARLPGTKEDGAPLALKSRDEGVVPTVHAFNVLRMAFHDTTLATDTSGFCAEGLVTAIRAFSSSHWEVRNSATLAFTALVHRTIGFLNVFKRESARRAITGFEFFHRYPTLHPFLLEELQSAAWQLEHGAGNGPDGNSGQSSSFHPSLGPVLIILSRLKPSFINSDVEDWLNPSAFIPYVSQCATQRNLRIRALASQALAPLVSAKDLSGVLLRLAQSLPLSASGAVQVVENPTDCVTNGLRGPGVHQASSFNAIHGILLQICTLLSSNCTSLLDIEQRCKIATEVSRAVEGRLWLGSIRLCGCSIVIGSFLDMLGGLLSLAQLCQDRLPNAESLIKQLQVLLCELSCECLDDSTDSHDSTRVSLREKAAKLYFQTLLTGGCYLASDKDLKNEASDAMGVSCTSADANGIEGFSHYGGSESFGQFVRRLRQALVDRSYEVRLATLKVVKKHFDLQWAEQEKSVRGPLCQIDKSRRDYSFLRPLLIERLSVETHSPCIRRILQVIYSWTLIDSRANGTPVTRTALDTDSVWGSGLSSQDLWRSLFKIYETSKDMKTKEVAVRCLGGCLQHITVDIVDFMKSSDASRASHRPSGNLLLVDQNENGVSQLDCSSNGTVRKDVSSSKASVDIWLDIAKAHSAASEAVNFRRATAEAVVASGLLEDAKWVGLRLTEGSRGDVSVESSGNASGTTDLEWFARAVLSAWCICIKFLEDEDLDLRQKLALSILKVVTRADSETEDVVPAQVEKVIQVSFEFLSSQFGEWREYYEILAEWILGSEDNADVVSGGDDYLIRRLFNKEIDNHHGEELLFVQLCCLHVERFLRASGEAAALSDATVDSYLWFGPYLWKWRMKYLERARLCAKVSMQINNRTQWVGGVTNHEDTFRSLYRSLLGLLTFVGLGRDRTDSPHEEQFVCGLTEVSDLLRQLPLNPLVSNIVVQVLEAFEQQLQVRLGSSEIRADLKLAFSENFSPLFLIS